MSDPRIPRIVYLLLLILGLLQWLHMYPELPARMASHFAADGTPNGYAPKEMFFVLMSFALLSSAFLTFIVPIIIASKSAARINLPNRSYWLSPERSSETFRFLTAYMSWFGCAVLFVLLYGTSQAMNANLPDGHFNSAAMLRVMIGFVTLVAASTIYLIRRFSRIPESVPQ
jgi:uncharacterized membrane protein